VRAAGFAGAAMYQSGNPEDTCPAADRNRIHVGVQGLPAVTVSTTTMLP
jgi:hypothetical protein